VAASLMYNMGTVTPRKRYLWSRDGNNLVIAGDQILSSISPNVGSMPPTHGPIPLAKWIEHATGCHC